MIIIIIKGGGGGGRGGGIGKEEPAEGGVEATSPDFLPALEEFIGVDVARAEDEEEAEDGEEGVG